VVIITLSAGLKITERYFTYRGVVVASLVADGVNTILKSGKLFRTLREFKCYSQLHHARPFRLAVITTLDPLRVFAVLKF